MKRLIRFLLSTLLLPPGVAAQAQVSGSSTQPQQTQTAPALPKATTQPQDTAQQPSTLPDAPRAQYLSTFLPFIGAFAGGGTSSFDHMNRGSVQTGVFLQLGYFQLEGAYLARSSDGRGTGVFSSNLWIPISPLSKPGRFTTHLTGGYSFLGGRGSGVNAGIGIDVPFNESQDHSDSVRFEVRDYVRLEDRLENNVGFRIGWVRSQPFQD